MSLSKISISTNFESNIILTSKNKNEINISRSFYKDFENNSISTPLSLKNK